MNTASTSPAEHQAASTSGEAAVKAPRILVWDAPVRVFHWLLVLCFAGAWLSAESERWRLLHVSLGYTMAGLVAFRLVWGLVGSRHARFASFVRGPVAAWTYVMDLLRGRAPHHSGHNPAGALAIVGLLGLSVAVVASGWAMYEDVAAGGEWLEEAHEAAATAMLALVGVHLLGVIVGSLAHRENLVAAMWTGRKSGPPEDGIRQAWRSVAVLMLGAVLAFWAFQWQTAAGTRGATGTAVTAAGAAHATAGPAAHNGGRDDDDDDD